MGASKRESKLIDRFETFDRNGDGAISQQDFELMADGILRACAQSPKSEKGRRLQDEARRYFEGFARTADTDRDGRISRNEFVAAAQDALRGQGGFEGTLRPWAEAVISVADHDDDGRVSVDEWTRVLTAMGAGREQATMSARGLDTDRDGHIGTDELLAEARRFYASNEAVDVFSVR